MYKIKVISYFSAAHNLRNYQGKCEALHGHNWKVEVIVSSDKLDKAGMVMDFSGLKKITAAVLEDLDHKYLNDLDYFSNGKEASDKGKNPSSEEIAQYIFDKLNQTVKDKGCCLEEIRVWETENSCAIYYEVKIEEKNNGR